MWCKIWALVIISILQSHALVITQCYRCHVNIVEPCIVLHYIVLIHITLSCVSLRCITLHCVVWLSIALLTFHCVVSCYIVLHTTNVWFAFYVINLNQICVDLQWTPFDVMCVSWFAVDSVQGNTTPPWGPSLQLSKLQQLVTPMWADLLDSPMCSTNVWLADRLNVAELFVIKFPFCSWSLLPFWSALVWGISMAMACAHAGSRHAKFPLAQVTVKQPAHQTAPQGGV